MLSRERASYARRTSRAAGAAPQRLLTRAAALVWTAFLFGTLTPAQEFVSDSLDFQSRYGHAVSVGDFNGDGHPDLAVAAWNDNVAGPDYGRVYLHLGPIVGNERDQDAEVVFQPNNFQMFGYDVTFGDWNGDEFDDVLIGSLDAESDGQGKGYVFLGGPQAGVFHDEDAYATFDGSAYSGLLGFCVAMGDWNGDGLDDALIGARGEDSYDGKAYLFLGGRSGVIADGDADVIFDGVIADGQVGQSCAFGDWNGDGRADVFLGAQGPGNSELLGQAYLFFGGDREGTLPTSQADVVFDGAGGPNKFGHAVDLGDWDGDGLDDVIIGDPRYDDNAGSAYVFVSDGQAGSFDKGDATYVMDGTDGSGDGQFGWSVSLADQDMDGYADALVSARFDDRGCLEVDCGRVFLFRGGRVGSTLDSSAVRALSGSTEGERFGYDSDLLDSNGDGAPDIIVGASRAVTSVGSSGRVYAFDSGTSTNGRIITARPAGAPLLIGKSADQDISITWGKSCSSSDNDYSVYEGTLGDFDSHRPVACSTNGRGWLTFTPSAESTYFLVVPCSPASEGSYGVDSRDKERLPSEFACRPQAIGTCGG